MTEEPHDDPRPSVALTVATTGTLRRETAASVVATSRNPNYRVTISFLNDRPYESAMNRAAADIISVGFDWWLHLDSDQYWRSDPLESISHDKDLIGFPAPIFHPGGGPGSPAMCFNAWHLLDPEDDTRVKAAEANGKMQRVDVIGSGSFLVHVPTLSEAAIPAPFARRYDVNGVVDRGPDVEFCRKWREAGLQIWADFSCVCGHFNTIDLLEVFADMVAIQKAVRDADKAESNGQENASRIIRPHGRPV